MEENVGVPRTANDAEGLSVVTSLGEVSEQITITEELPNEHDSNQQYEQNPSESASNAVQQCEVQVVKVANVGGGMNITFSTPALITRSEEDGGQTHTIQVAESALAPIQEVAIASPENSNRSDTPIQGDCDIHEEQDQESLHIQEGSSPEPSHRRDDNHKSTSWDAVINAEVLSVRCRNETAELHKSKLGSGGRGKCIKYNDEWMTPSEFEARCGRASSKDWKRSIRYSGRTLQTLIEEGVLTPHATSCTCASCCNDDTLAGPVRLFVPYKRRKRVSSQSSLASPVLKKSMSLSSDPTKREGGHSLMMRSASVDSAGGTFVTESGNAIEAGDIIQVSSGAVAHLQPLMKDLSTGIITVSSGASIPHTPMTPMTPLTPMAPMTPGLSTPGTPIVTQMTSMAHNAAVTMAVPVSEVNMEQKRNWWHIEEMVNSLLSTAQQLKCMIEQAKLQSEAAREAAVAQAKLQAEAEKKELLSQTRMNSLIQLTKALNDAQAEREQAVQQALQHAKADKMEAVADARQQQFIKTYTGQAEAVTSEQQAAEDKNGME
ncbi:deformed epidermal autoregulatory factor 1 homolog [Nematostella vectensis]|uniref:deformed epidermal autoregulatory factor 1 homolog n=1 Tax=Nematostella vectensis TaxID=45351 RepID=UPI0020775D69|nr:deformed epidermal autoregulatory factor 1 homolog [Nematostella vectensis]